MLFNFYIFYSFNTVFWHSPLEHTYTNLIIKQNSNWNFLCTLKIILVYSKVRFHYINWLLPCPFTGQKTFYAGPNFLSQPKNLTTFSASSKTFLPAQKPILLNANHLFVWHKMFVTGTICK
jgi:hypothetical protein